MPTLEIVKESFISEPDALILTHIGGYPNPQINEISKLCDKKNILLIEDCAHSPLVEINNKYVGTFGDAAILSFFPTKPIPAGEGGMVILKKPEIAEKIRKMRDYGKFVDKKGKTKHILPAFPNARLNEYSAVITNTILKNYLNLLSLKIKIADFYNSKIQENLFFSSIYKEDMRPQFSYYKYICFLNNSKFKTSQVYDSDNQLISIFKDNDLNFKFFGEEEFAKEHICLPITYSMTIEDAQIVLDNAF